MSAFVAVAAALLSSGREVPSVHSHEYLYADMMEGVAIEEAEYNAELNTVNRRKEDAWKRESAEYMKQLTQLEYRYGLVAVQHRKEHHLGDGRVDPFAAARSHAPALGTNDREEWENQMNAALGKLGPPPPQPHFRTTPFSLAVELKDPEKAAFLFRHSALVNSFMTGNEGWHDLFFGTTHEAFGDRLPVPVFLEQVRKTFLVTHRWPGFTRASLPTPEYFVYRYRNMYPEQNTHTPRAPH